MLEKQLMPETKKEAPGLKLESGSRVGVIGAGPAGSFFSIFFLQMAGLVGLDVLVDLYEPRDFSQAGPQGCNMCGGVISESLVQNLAAEGINLPSSVVQRGLDSYFLHMDVGSVRIETPLQEKRIAAVHRGCGPRGIKEELKRQGFDGYVFDLARSKGGHWIQKRVEKVDWDGGRPRVHAPGGLQQTYDLLVVAAGVNTKALGLFQELGLTYRPPQTTKTYISEFWMGREIIKKYLGSSMHVFLLNLPQLEFAALIPKGDYVTFCLLGHEIDRPLVQALLDSSEMKQCLPPQWKPPDDPCHCSPRLSIHGAIKPYADRVVFVGDCGVTRLYKDGIGAAYRTAKAAAKTAVFRGIAAEDFHRFYWPACRALLADNRIGNLVFAVTRQIQKRGYVKRGMWRMVCQEQLRGAGQRRMSTVLWDTFTGSAPYREVFLRTLHPFFLSRFLWEIAKGAWPSRPAPGKDRKP